MGEKVKVNGKAIKIVREPGYLYFTKGSPIGIYRTRMQHKGRTKSKQPSTLVLKTRVMRTPGFLYYVDKSGFLAKARMFRGKNK
jgi:hypothetical protein